MDYQSTSKRVQAAADLLQKREINRSTVDSLRTLLHGIHPSLDKKLDLLSRQFTHIERFQKGDVIALTAEALPEFTPEQKKRKKALLLFLKFWHDVKSEVARLEKEMNQGKHASHHGTTRTLGRILAGAKGPLAIVTILAAGIVALKATEVSILINNTNCASITPGASAAITIPGLSVPENIPSGGEAIAKLPPVSMTVDAMSGKEVQLTMYGMKYNFSLANAGMQLVFDGKTLNGQKTNINLNSAKEHVLVLECK